MEMLLGSVLQAYCPVDAGVEDCPTTSNPGQWVRLSPISSLPRWLHGEEARGGCWGMGVCWASTLPKLSSPGRVGGNTATAKVGRWGIATALGRLGLPLVSKMLAACLGVDADLTHLLLGSYSHTGCGNRLAQLLQGWPWLHYGTRSRPLAWHDHVSSSLVRQMTREVGPYLLFSPPTLPARSCRSLSTWGPRYRGWHWFGHCSVNDELDCAADTGICIGLGTLAGRKADL
jgi:hypothetical protein